MKTAWNFATAGQLTFGPGAVAQVGQLVRDEGATRLLVVTDQNLVTAGIAQRVTDSLRAAKIDVETFAAGEAEPAIETAEAVIGIAGKTRPNAILGLGGGSNLDLAKICAVVLAHGGHPRDYFGFDRVPGPIAPLIAIPTTAGTGSEVSHAAVLTDRSNAMKVSTLSRWLRPKLAIVDPELTYTCPRQVVADSGIDALTHAIEAYTATDFDRLEVPEGESSAYEGRFPLGETLAESSIRLIGLHLADAVHDAGNHLARNQMALAATLAGMAFSNCGVALVHSLEYPLGGALHCSHGAGNGLLLPYVMRFNLPERTKTMGKIARLLGVEVQGLSETEAAEAAIDAVVKLRQQIGIPNRIRELGGTRDQLPEFAEKSFALKRLLWINPRQASREDLIGILEAAF